MRPVTRGQRTPGLLRVGRFRNVGDLRRGESGRFYAEVRAEGAETETVAGLVPVPRTGGLGGAVPAPPTQR